MMLYRQHTIGAGLASGGKAIRRGRQCFSNEYGLSLPANFGIRIEDCFHMTDSGPIWFSKPQVSIEYPGD
jgi:hypothetical protein